MEQNLETLAQFIVDKKSEDISLPMLTSTLSFLMTRFVKRPCPQLAQFIVRHIRLVIEHPEIEASQNCRTLYLQLLEQWQIITAALLEQSPSAAKEERAMH